MGPLLMNSAHCSKALFKVTVTFQLYLFNYLNLIYEHILKLISTPFSQNMTHDIKLFFVFFWEGGLCANSECIIENTLLNILILILFCLPFEIFPFMCNQSRIDEIVFFCFLYLYCIAATNGPHFF